MTTCVLFPGLNGLLKKEDRFRFLKMPFALKMIHRGIKIYDDTMGSKTHLLKLLNLKRQDLYKRENIHLCAIIISSIQVSLFQHYKKHLPHDAILMGCSLGDLARGICANIISFDDAIRYYLKFSVKTMDIDQIGMNVALLSQNGLTFNEEDLLAIKGTGVEISPMSPKFVNASGLNQDIKKLETVLERRNIKMLPIINYPVHSRHVAPYVQDILHEYDHVHVEQPTYPVFSSLSSRFLTDPQIIKKEFLECMIKTVDWNKSVRSLVDEHKIKTFINIGPCQSLPRIMRDIGGDYTIYNISEYVA